MTASDDFDDFTEPTSSRRDRRRSLLPWRLIAVGIGVAWLFIGGGVAAILLLGKPDETAVTPAANVAPARTPRTPPATAEDAETLGRRIEAAAGDEAAIDGLLDWDILAGRATAGLDVPKDGLTAFMAGAREGASRALRRRFGQSVAEGGRLDFLRVVEHDGHSRALCRLIEPEGGVDFFEFLPVMRGGEPQVADAYVYSTGEDMSAMLRRALIPVAADLNRGLLERLAGRESDLVRHSSDLERLSEAFQREDWPDVLSRYDTLPESLRREKFVLVAALGAAGFSDEGRYTELVEVFRSAYPDDPALELLLVDYHYLRGEINAAIDALRTLDGRVGGDAYVKTLIAGMLLERGDGKEAERLLGEAVAAEPDLVQPRVGLVGTAVTAGDHARAVHLLEEMERHIELDPAGLREALAVYAGAGAFFASEAFQEWEAAR